MRLGDREIGIKAPCFIIAEAGVNHNGDIKLAKKLIDAAAKAKADAVKFQTFVAERLVTKDARKADYQKKAKESNDQFSMLKKLELSEKDHKTLKRYANAKGLIFLSTPFDFESADFLESIGIQLYKLSSGEVTNLPFLEYIGKKGKPIILSTGMATLDEVNKAVNTISKAGKSELALLQCNTAYPTPPEDANIKAMIKLHDFANIIGYSDHTMGIYAPIAAVALGAKIIEKHFTLDKKMEGPDHKASIEPEELKEMVRAIRIVEKMLGSGKKSPSGSERKNIGIVRKRIIAKKVIKPGERITADHLDFKRSAKGIDASNVIDIIGKRSKKEIKKEEAVLSEYVED